MEETNGDLELVKGEFGQRLHELERKLQNALREKELVKKQLMVTQEEVHNRCVILISVLAISEVLLERSIGKTTTNILKSFLKRANS